nr:helix-turn-helix domain-containing protein [Wenzhouxiangella sp. XN24]
MIARRLEALGQPTRLAIFRRLVRAGPDGRTVGELQAALDVPASTLSFHLKRLIEVGLVYQERSGATLYCLCNHAVMQATVAFMLRECCTEAVGYKGQPRGGPLA